MIYLYIIHIHLSLDLFRFLLLGPFRLSRDKKLLKILPFAPLILFQILPLNIPISTTSSLSNVGKIQIFLEQGWESRGKEKCPSAFPCFKDNVHSFSHYACVFALDDSKPNSIRSGLNKQTNANIWTGVLTVS